MCVCVCGMVQKRLQKKIQNLNQLYKSYPFTVLQIRKQKQCKFKKTSINKNHICIHSLVRYNRRTILPNANRKNINKHKCKCKWNSHQWRNRIKITHNTATSYNKRVRDGQVFFSRTVYSINGEADRQGGEF